MGQAILVNTDVPSGLTHRMISAETGAADMKIAKASARTTILTPCFAMGLTQKTKCEEK